MKHFLLFSLFSLVACNWPQQAEVVPEYKFQGDFYEIDCTPYAPVYGPMAVTRYMEQNVELTKDMAEFTGIDVVVLMALGMFESGCGKSRIALENNNYFGLKGKSGWMHFETKHDCYVYQASLLKKRYREAAGLSMQATCDALETLGYCRDTLYAEKLLGIAQKYVLPFYTLPPDPAVKSI